MPRTPTRKRNGTHKADDDGKPPMELRPIYVEYVAVRLCRYNPSWSKGLTVPKLHRSDLWNNYVGRRPGREMPARLDLSRPPNQKSDEE